MKFYLLFCFLFLDLFRPGASQNGVPNPKCQVTWQRHNDTNHRNAFKTSSQTSEAGCLDECIGTPGCLAVDVDKRNAALTYFFECWFHGNDADLDISYHFPGVDTYVKKVTCPAGIVPGMPGAEELWKQYGPTGPTGPTGIRGYPGPIGVPGAPGSPGYTGMTGGTGFTGPSGSVGASGATGLRGISGINGANGFYGPVGVKGQQGLPGRPGVMGAGVYVRSSSCNATWATLKNTMSPGWRTTYTLNSIDLCLRQCLSTIDCMVFEYTTSTGTCYIPTDVTDLNTKFAAYGIDQIVITSRCATKGQTDFTGFINGPSRQTRGVIGATGGTGSTGPTGSTGMSGFTGPRGKTGMMGIQGYMGIYGIQGVQGSTGSTGQRGMPGFQGPTGMAGPPGQMLPLKDQCEPTWVLINDVTSPGYTTYPKATKVDECMDYCLSLPSCVAVEFLVTSPPCRIILNLGSLDDKIKSPGAIQLVLVERCPLNSVGPSTSPSATGTYAPLQSDESPKPPGDQNPDVSISNPWSRTFLFTLLSILLTDALCGIVIITWNKCSKTRASIAD